jgi:metal-responsive CopG/Arc/MetJ family transcriptional regulator
MNLTAHEHTDKRVTSFYADTELLLRLDELVKGTDMSRNQLIRTLLEYGLAKATLTPKVTYELTFE